MATPYSRGTRPEFFSLEIGPRIHRQSQKTKHNHNSTYSYSGDRRVNHAHRF